MTRYVKSAEEIRALLRLHAEPAFLGRRGLAIQFETDPAFVRAVLPPPLVPAERPLASVGISSFRASNCVGPFDGGAITVRCRYGEGGGIEGQYCITMPMSTDTAVIYGRELYAEPKKLAAVTLEREGNRARATVTRHGVAYIELDAELSEPVPDGDSEVNNFYFKYTIAADGSGLDHDPLLVCVRSESTIRNAVRGSGTIRFAASPHDPVADIPIVRVLGAVWSEGDTFTHGRTLGSVPADQFLPYAFAKMDDLTCVAASAEALAPIG
ncbi:MAG TPA: acetoacetate decarboxylase family protein [Dehalococcoidia bacterium]|nr:acetoacetate decarboxylase family protein [Dehalococcoidia bacterium]